MKMSKTVREHFFKKKNPVEGLEIKKAQIPIVSYFSSKRLVRVKKSSDKVGRNFETISFI